MGGICMENSGRLRKQVGLAGWSASAHFEWCFLGSKKLEILPIHWWNCPSIIFWKLRILSRFGLIVSKIWSPATGNPVTVIWLLDEIQLKASSDIRLKFVLSNTFCSRITITIIVIFRMLYYHRALGKPVLLETRYCCGGMRKAISAPSSSKKLF